MMTAKSAREDRRKYWTEIATSMEQASNVGDTQKLYQRIYQASGKLSSLNDSVHDANGGFLVDNVTKVEHWCEHFEHLNFDMEPSTPCSLLQQSLLHLPLIQCHATRLMQKKSPMP
ncbi:unnamed protein product [Dibothriocephalus latus]|uniref:Uncharacterized protein n=1 Tax=Dibothriocephalus latus TaxID=60516 RepID=A0A3P7PJQ5_DIBLA|nr:unnamed protein product [Dibothriocephalus latus]